MANFLIFSSFIGLLAVLFMVQLPLWAGLFLFFLAFQYGIAIIVKLTVKEDEI